MKILFTGATGVVGRASVPGLVEAGHVVDGVARSRGDARWLRSVGARPIELDLFDHDAVAAAVAGVDAIVHFATAIPPMAKMARSTAWRTNDRLRSEATSTLVDAAIEHGVETFVRESISFTYGDGGEAWLTEDSAVDPPSPIVVSALAAEGEVARFSATGGRAIALRLGHLYGPGRASQEYVEAVMERSMPVIGDGSNYVSSLHVVDAGTAVTAALTAPSGVYNVSDREPVRAHQVVESLAEILGAPAPRHVPRLLARAALRSVYPLATVSQRVTAERFRDATGWRPRYGSVVDGWVDVAARSSVTRAA